MKHMVWAAVFVAAFTGAAGAQGPVPDPWWPSNIEVVPAPGRGANTLGYNSRGWTFTQTQTDPRGNLYGFDEFGNYWTYNRRNNTYLNYYNLPRWQARCYSNVADLC